ncbi:MAG: class II aldolase/adducin family protein [Actinomycetota bacterium]|jgi:rhamnose utilization protein RhaD (predicted bifunctional aldolase and dehydrogenase)
MPLPEEILNDLIAMSRRLADPALDYVILGEGNTSAGVDAGTFYVKASGVTLRDIPASGFVRVRRAPILELLDRPTVTDDEIRDGMLASRVDTRSSIRPSVETLFHAYLLSLPGVNYVGHTHPTAVNAVLCSQKAEEAVSGRLFPDEIVCCGPAPCFVPYVDPGQPLARAMKERVEAYIDEHNASPRVILMQNHGFIALGRSPEQVESATAMFVKTARILLGTYALGGPNFLSPENVSRIYTRPDEKYREKQIGVG